ncbi:hepatocyte cell adhesion molecule-like isoform X2 [Mercenaria mercenaria]|uniref:hepatocyte cell adhesion molecule-like isoform X2 n=1 Tax=Mercenaria mercenaria TaxID=6596 RepID=UPI001E1DFF82|nr:hepatocyte cell adhesion molecule-like isoform X2 [Mercenaria mercenaria]
MDFGMHNVFYIFWIVQTCVQWPMAKLLDKEFQRKMLPPKFYPTPTNVTYEKGGLAILYCSIENLGTKTVIWRKQPYNVPITVGQEQFVEINRFYLSHVPYREEWNLLIKNVQPFDAGTYECQISSTEKVLRRNITLNVVESSGLLKPEISITGTRVVEKGKSIHLTCQASGTTSPPEGIDWYKDGNILTTEKRGDLLIEKQISFTTRMIVSRLTIAKSYMSDTGTFVCRTPELLTATFKVDVLNHPNDPDRKDKRGMENEALTHGGSGNIGGYPRYSGQTDIHIKQIYRRIKLHHLVVFLSYFVTHFR